MSDVETPQDVIMFRADSVGDGSYYNVVVANWTERKQKQVYVAVGGEDALYVGGFIPHSILNQFEIVITTWAYGNEEQGFFDKIADQSWFQHILDKQMKRHEWDLVAAFVFAWLFLVLPRRGTSLVENHSAMTILGHLHFDRHKKVREIIDAELHVIPY